MARSIKTLQVIIIVLEGLKTTPGLMIYYKDFKDSTYIILLNSYDLLQQKNKK